MSLNTLFGLLPGYGLAVFIYVVGFLYLMTWVARIIFRLLVYITANTKFWFIPYLLAAVAVTALVAGLAWLWWWTNFGCLR